MMRLDAITTPGLLAISYFPSLSAGEALSSAFL
jgi:hypothetical protein